MDRYGQYARVLTLSTLWESHPDSCNPTGIAIELVTKRVVEPHQHWSAGNTGALVADAEDEHLEPGAVVLRDAVRRLHPRSVPPPEEHRVVASRHEHRCAE